MVLFVSTKLGYSFEIAESISKSFGEKRLLLVKFNGKLIGHNSLLPLKRKVLEIVTPDHGMPWTSCVTQPRPLVCSSVSASFPEIKFRCRSSYSRMVSTMIRTTKLVRFQNDDLPRIQEEMMKIVKENFPSEFIEEVTKEEALEIFKMIHTNWN